MTRAALRGAARRILRAGLEAVEPGRLVRAHLQVEGRIIRAGGIASTPKRVFVVCVGKAAATMARAAHKILGRRMTRAIVIAPSRAPGLPRTEAFVSGHPIPDAAGIRAGKCVIRLLERADEGDLVLLLLSGGASALMPAPKKGVALRDKQRVTRLLLQRGADITEVNAVRKELSRLKGGGFARIAAPARVITLALSDVPGDDVRTIGSGPTVDDPRSHTLARRAIRKFLSPDEVPTGVELALTGGPARSSRRESTGRGQTVIVGSGRTFARSALRMAQELGFRTQVLPDRLHGEARVCGPRLVAEFEAFRRRAPLCLIATGETVVRVLGRGRGGRNQELALSAIPALGLLDRPTVLAAFATDGVDGRSSASGGLVDDQTLNQALGAGISVLEVLDRNDSNPALHRLGSLITTGPTGTNVADVTLVLG